MTQSNNLPICEWATLCLLWHGRKTNHVRGDGSFPRKRSPDAGDGCTADHRQPGLRLAAELDAIADAGAGDPGICNGPTGLMHSSKKGRSLDHLVGAKQDRLRHRKAERLGGLEVYDHLELGRKLHREIARLRAAQDAIDIGGGTTKGV
jgi:hypothetical protein